MISYYQILELLPNATEEEIKKAYRRLARLYHPDGRNLKSRDKTFIEIQQAYETLSDGESRRRYDKTHGFVDWQKEKVAEYSRNQQRSERAAGRNDAKKPSAMRRRTDAPKQQQKKAGPGIKLFKTLEEDLRALKAKAAETFGVKAKLRQFTLVVDAWESLRGVKKELDISQAGGKPRLIRVRIPAGVEQAALLRVKCPERGGFREEMIEVRIIIVPHRIVERVGADIIVKMPISLGEAVHGTVLKVPTLEGTLKLRLPAQWAGEKDIRVKNRGVEQADGRRGDLYVRTQLVPPQASTKALQSAVDVLERTYPADLRVSIPRSLK